MQLTMVTAVVQIMNHKIRTHLILSLQDNSAAHPRKGFLRFLNYIRGLKYTGDHMDKAELS